MEARDVRLCEASMLEVLAQLVSDLKPVIISQKGSAIDVWQDPYYTPGNDDKWT